MALDYTNVAVTGSEVDSGPGTLDFGAGNTNADPLFADPGDPANPGDKSVPETLRGKGPKKRITSRRAKFEFSSEPGATFRCSLDGNPITTCTSPTTVRRLKRGKHAFTAAAVDAAGNLDPTPVRFRFRVKPR